MNSSDLSTIVFVQADVVTGMGHLARSAALVRALRVRGYHAAVYLVGDEVGRLTADGFDLTLYDGEDLPECVIIDACSVTVGNLAWLNQFTKRILISPVFNQAEIATHAYLRCIDDAISKQLSPVCVTEVDFDFSFVTCGGLVARSLSYETLNVGICLTGGDDCGIAADLATILLGDCPVDSVVVASRSPRTSRIDDDRLRWRNNSSDSIWDFFSGINLFIGTDGIMVAEAIAQNIPVISVGANLRDAKIAPLAAAGCLRRSTAAILASIARDRSALVAMHSAARQFDGLRRVPKLATRVIAALKQG